MISRSRAAGRTVASLAAAAAAAAVAVQFYDLFIVTATLSSAVLAWSFVLSYLTLSPGWRRNAVGRALMGVYLSLAAVLTLVAASYGLGEYPGREVLRVLVYGSLPVTLFVSLRVLRRVQRLTRDDRVAEAIAAASRDGSP